MNRKGITPIIAVVLLLMMTVAAAGLAYQFVIGTQTDIQEGLKGQVSKQQIDAEAKIQIDSVYNSTTGNQLTIIVRNIGTYTYSAGDFQVYLDGVPLAGTWPTTQLAPKAVTTITATGRYPATVGSSISIRIVPSVGPAISQHCRNEGRQFC